MARFMGLSPYSNPIEAGIKTFSDLSNVFNQRDEMDIRRRAADREDQEATQRRQLNDIRLSSAQREDQEAIEDAPIRKMERETKKKDLAAKIATQTYGPGLTEAMIEYKSAMAEGRPPKLSVNAIANVLGFADDHSHFGSKENKMGDHVRQATAANDVVRGLARIGPALEQYSQQTGQAAHRIDNSNAPGFIDDINTMLKGSSFLPNGKQVKAIGVDMSSGEATFQVTDKGGNLEILKGDDGKTNRFSISDLQHMANNSAEFGTYLVSAYGQVHGNDKLMEEVSKKKAELAMSHKAAEVLDEYIPWEKKQEEKLTVSERKAELDKRLMKAGVDPATRKQIVARTGSGENSKSP